MSNGYQQLITNSKHQIKKPIQTPPTPLKDKEKWATFKYFGPHTRIITNLFRDTNIKIAFKTVNTIQHHLRAKEATGDTYNQSGIYQLQCNECPLKYIGQTGHTFREHYKEHINAIRFNKQHSKFGTHILNTGHSYNMMEENLESATCRKEGAKAQYLRKILYT
jgi:hypothetical protein